MGGQLGLNQGPADYEQDAVTNRFIVPMSKMDDTEMKYQQARPGTLALKTTAFTSS